ncbi:hypothetical protein STRDD13_00714 [Streptococcus sp. DD13]|nr:hypothetical protein STRDD13_00714 [Streptococcus sp. DD13]
MPDILNVEQELYALEDKKRQGHASVDRKMNELYDRKRQLERLMEDRFVRFHDLIDRLELTAYCDPSQLHHLFGSYQADIETAYRRKERDLWEELDQIDQSYRKENRQLEDRLDKLQKARGRWLTSDQQKPNP